MTESQARYHEALEILLRAWTEERFSYAGQFWQIHNAQVVPRPLQQPHPPLLTGGTSEATSALAGARGYSLLLAPVLPFAALERWVRVYQEACAKHGHPPHIVYLRPIYLGDDPAQIRRECEPFLLNFVAAGARSAALMAESPEELERAGYGFYGSAALKAVPKLSYEEMVEQEWVFVGSPAQVIDKIGWLQDKAGITEFDMLANYGGIAHWQSLKQQELFARQVIPALR